MKYTLQESESFDAEILRQELVAAIGPTGWHLNSAGNQVEFVAYAGDHVINIPDVESVIQLHFANYPKREHNKAILKQITDLEATQTPRRIREGGQWMIDLESQIAALRRELE